MHKLERYLLQLTILLLPLNLSLHYYFDQAYINGRLIDYLLPKIYISDIPIFILIAIFLYKSISSLDISILFNKEFKHILKSTSIIYGLFFLYLMAVSLVSTNPTSSFWYVLKIIEYSLFVKYLSSNYSYSSFLKIITFPLILGLIVQLTITFIQYISETSVFEYYFLGESNLNAIDAVKTSSAGILEVVPYGTTPHPNVLAGYITLSCLLLYLRSTLVHNKLIKQTAILALIGLSLVIFKLTHSISALSGLILSLLVYHFKFLFSNTLLRLLLLMWYIITPILIVLILNLNHQYKFLTDSSSINHRYELNYAAISIIKNNPLSGVGPNLFTANLTVFPVPGQQIYFLQPVHNWLLLVLSEIGFIGFSLLILNILVWINLPRLQKASKTSFLPLWLISTILFLDHYPLSLQTGQLLLSLALVLPSLNNHMPDESLFQNNISQL